MKEERRPGVCSPGGKLGFGRGNSTRGPAVCRGTSNKYISLGLGPFDPSVLPTRGVSVLSGGSFLEQTVTRSCSH